MIRPLIFAIALCYGGLTAPVASAAIDDLNAELSPQGRVIVQCVAFYKAMKDVIVSHHPEMKDYGSGIDAGSPLMLKILGRADTRGEHLSKAITREVQDKAMAEFKRTYPEQLDDVKKSYPSFDAVTSSWKKCSEQNRWLIDRGVDLPFMY